MFKVELVPDQDVYVFEVSSSSFNTSVILNSYKLPVIVEFMAVWSAPCIQMSDNLASLAREYAGQFIFAKVDIDEQEALKKEYAIKNVPCLKVFKDGKVVRTEEGQLQDKELRELLKNYGVFRQSDELREQARHKHMQGETTEAIVLLTNAIKEDPANTRVAMDMVQIFLDLSEFDQARSLFNRLPEADRLSETGKSLLGQLTFRELAEKTEGKQNLEEKIVESADDCDARFDLAVCLIAEHDYVKSMDNLFYIFEHEPEYKEGAAKEMIISLINMLAENEPELSQEFRRRMGNTIN